MTPYTFYDELYGVNYHLFVGKSESYIKKFVNKTYDVEFNLDTSDMEGCCCAFHSAKGFTVLIILNSKFDGSPALTAILAHECYHAVEFVLRDRGVSSNKSTSEAWAYYLSYLMEKFLIRLSSLRKRTK